MESSVVGAYWGDRRESAAECGRRLAECVGGLGMASPVLASWFRLGVSKAAAKTPVAADASSLAELFEKGRSRRDDNGEAIKELGFRVAMWNRARPAVKLSTRAGSYAGNPGIVNSFLLNLPAPDDGGAALYGPGTARAVFEAAVSVWEPEWATWTTAGWRAAQSRAPREPVVGWLTFLRGARPGEPVGWDSWPLSGGLVVQAAPDFQSTDEAAVIAIRQQLQRLGALRPMP